MKDGRIDNNEAKKIFKTLEDMEGSKIDYSYLKLINGSIGINVAKLIMKEFQNDIDRLKKKKAKKQSYKINKKICLRKC